MPLSDAAPLWRTATVVRDRSHVLDGLDVQSAGGERANRGFASRSRTLDLHVDGPHSMFLRQLGRILCGDLRGERSSLARSLESDAARARPREHVAHRI